MFESSLPKVKNPVHSSHETGWTVRIRCKCRAPLAVVDRVFHLPNVRDQVRAVREIRWLRVAPRQYQFEIGRLRVDEPPDILLGGSHRSAA